MGIEVLIVQHGDKVRSAGDPGLTSVGHQQVAKVASWLSENHPGVRSIWASPLRRTRETAAPIAAAFQLGVQTDDRLRERMNWDDDTAVSLEQFLAEWQRASDDPSYRPATGDSSSAAAERFIAALVDIEERVQDGVVIVVAHGGVTVDALRGLVGDNEVRATNPNLIENGVPCGAITELRVDDRVVSVVGYPSTEHLDETSSHRPV